MTFIDTNIFVYSVDINDGWKNDIATDILAEASCSDEYMISAQVINEFCSVMLRKFKRSEDQIKEHVDSFSEIRAVPVMPGTAVRALEIKKRYDLQFYDSLLLATAEANGCTEFLSEDLNDGQIYCGMKAVNPFKTAQEGGK